MIYNKKSLIDLNLENETVLVRLDLNVPIKDGKVSDDKRIREALPTLEYLLDNKCKIIVLSHFSRIKSIEDKLSNKKTLRPVYEDIKNKLPNVKIDFCENNTNPKLKEIISNMSYGSVLILENTRYNDVESDGSFSKKESKNDPNLGKFWASLGNVFVNDAFGTAHRAHASNVGIATNINESCVGFLVEKEIKMLSKVLDSPFKPFVAIFGGAKISDKIESIENIAKLADHILIGGGMSFTFLKALGHNVGISLVENDSINVAKDLLKKYPNKIVLPIDVLCSKDFSDSHSKHFSLEIDDDYMGLDIGPDTIKLFSEYLDNANTIIWNGPVGVFEFEHYSKGTKAICKYMKEATDRGALTIVGGGDSAASAISFGYENAFSHISTGGGASLVFFEGKNLIGIDAIKDNF
ncbi:MAG: phosphoglycerate kinase [Malacoplasma sp.]